MLVLSMLEGKAAAQYKLFAKPYAYIIKRAIKTINTQQLIIKVTVIK